MAKRPKGKVKPAETRDTHTFWKSELDAVVEMVPCAAMLEIDGELVTWNETARRLHGIVGNDPFRVERVFLGAFPRWDDDLRGDEKHFSCALLRADGTMIPVHGALRAMMTEVGPARLITVMEHVLAENGAAGGGTILGDLLDAAPEAVAITRRGRLMYVNREFSSLFGLSVAECLGENLDELITPDAQRGNTDELYERLEREGRATMETMRLGPAGTLIDVSLLVGPIHLSGDEIGLFHTFRDIRPQKKAEAQLKHRALHDPLTGLANRALLTDRVQEALKRLKRDAHRKFSVLFLDLDGFKGINDSQGHEVGDQVLIAVSCKLRDCLRPQDTLARFGGDEFTVLLEDVPSIELVLMVAERIHATLAKAELPDGLRVGASIGITMVETAAKAAARVLREADIAMYQAKSNGKGRSVVFEAGMTMQGHAERESSAA